MIPATIKYQNGIKQAFRGQTHIRIEYGVEDKNTIYSFTSGAISDYSATMLEVWQNNNAIYDYAFLSNNYMRTDGSQLVLPDDSEDTDINRSGCVLDALSDDLGVLEATYELSLIDSSDSVLKELYGFVLTFDSVNNTYATSLDVKVYSNEQLIVTRQFENLDSTVFMFEEEIQNVSKVQIVVHSINKPNARLRISGFMLGINKTYTEKELMQNAFDYDRGIDVLSNELSYGELTFNVNNMDMSYNPFNLTGIYKRFGRMQPVTLYLGLEYETDSIEWLKVATLYTDEFSFDETSFSVSCVDLLSTLNKTNYFTPNNQKVADDNLTYKDLVQMLVNNSDGALTINDLIFIDKIVNNKVGCQVSNYSLNEILQLIANINQSIVYTDRNGVIRFKDAYFPKTTFDDNGHMPFSSVANAYNTNQLPTYTYIELTTNFFKAEPNDWQVIRPNNDEYLGYVSSMMCGSDGVFTNKPKLSINYSSPMRLESLYLVFDHLSNEYPTKFTVTYYNSENEEIKKLSFENNDLVEILSSANVDNAIKYEIEISKWSVGNRRAVINRIGEGVFEDYYLDFNMIKTKPSIELMDYVKDINCSYYQYAKDGVEYEEINDALFIGNGLQRFESDTAYDGFTVEKIGGTGEISNINGNFSNACEFTVSGNTDMINVKLKGYKIKEQKMNLISKFSNRGATYTLDNPLCISKEMAQTLCDWYYDYVKKGQTLTISYRGDYQLEPLDFIYVQSQYQTRLPVMITRTKLSYNGGLSGELEVLNV